MFSLFLVHDVLASTRPLVASRVVGQGGSQVLNDCSMGYGGSSQALVYKGESWMRPDANNGYAMDYNPLHYERRYNDRQPLWYQLSNENECARLCSGTCATFFIYMGTDCYTRNYMGASGWTSDSRGNGLDSSSTVWVQCSTVVAPSTTTPAPTTTTPAPTTTTPAPTTTTPVPPQSFLLNKHMYLTLIL